MRIGFFKFSAWIKKTVVITAAACLSLSAAQSAPRGTIAEKYAGIVIDANSGKTLYQVNANARRYPASLTKMMTLYLLYEALQSGRITPNTPIPVSAYAASRPPTKIGFKPGQTIPAEAAAKALITKSANDVASAIAEYLGGSEGRFAQMMTTKARNLGMMNTQFANASGLPDVRNYSTARDMAVLSLALRQHFPKQYAWFKTTSFQFRGQTINGHNRLVKSMQGVDGIKTGYVQMSGFNLASSIQRDGKSLVAVVMGGRTAASRDAHMADLLRSYLPKASRGKTAGRIYVANNNDSNTVDLPEKHEAPVPIAKHTRGNSTSDDAYVTALAPQQSNGSIAAVIAANGAVVPVPEDDNPPLPISKHSRTIDPVITASAPANSRPGPVPRVPVGNQNAPTPAVPVVARPMPQNQATANRGGWAIQVGSLPSRQQADALLAKVSNAKVARPVIAQATAVAVPFENKGKQFYRARFSGFRSQDAATKACATLKKANFNCYAISE